MRTADCTGVVASDAPQRAARSPAVIPFALDCRGGLRQHCKDGAINAPEMWPCLVVLYAYPSAYGKFSVLCVPARAV